MHNIKALEEDWKRYNRKKKIPWIILILLITVVLVLILARNNGMLKLQDTNMKNQVTTTPSTLQQSQPVFRDKALTKLEEQDREETVDAPMDTGFGESINETDMQESAALVSSKPPRKKLHIEVIETASSPEAFREIEKRFRLGHDADDSLFLARAYYSKGNYKKAEYWALQTNNINENIEESWLIFAKAKVRQGEKNEAIRILNRYIKKTNSIEAKVLLEKIKKGMIR